MENIDRDNKLIAEFMYPSENLPVYNSIHDKHPVIQPVFTIGKYKKYSVKKLKFHSSWDWLMPVVEKIESLVFPNDEYYNFNILGGCCTYIISSHGHELVCSDRGKSKLECVYKAVVEFIKWYNETN